MRKRRFFGAAVFLCAKPSLCQPRRGLDAFRYRMTKPLFAGLGQDVDGQCHIRQPHPHGLEQGQIGIVGSSDVVFDQGCHGAHVGPGRVILAIMGAEFTRYGFYGLQIIDRHHAAAREDIGGEFGSRQHDGAHGIDVNARLDHVGRKKRLG